MVSTREQIRRDGSTAYIARFRHKGKQTSETFDNPRARDRFARNVDKLGIDAALAILDATDNSAPDTPTLGELAAEHVDLIEASDYTRRRYRAYIRNDLGRLGDLPVDAITTDTVERWVRAMTDAGAAPKTVHNKHGFVAAVLNRAVRRKLITTNPTEGVRLPKVRRHKVDVLDADEFARFLDYLPARWHPLVIVLAATGLRWGEATALECRDIDLAGGRIDVNRAWKLNDEGWESDETKTVKSDRTVTISRELVDLLAPLMADRRPDALVFTNSKGDPIRHAYFHDSVWQPAVMLANGENPWPGRVRNVKRTSMWYGIRAAQRPLGKRPRIHSLRHTAASTMLAAGLDLKTVQEQLGHESIQTTANIYGHVGIEQRMALSAVQSRFLAGALPTVEDGPPQIEP